MTLVRIAIGSLSFVMGACSGSSETGNFESSGGSDFASGLPSGAAAGTGGSSMTGFVTATGGSVWTGGSAAGGTAAGGAATGGVAAGGTPAGGAAAGGAAAGGMAAGGVAAGGVAAGGVAAGGTPAGGTATGGMAAGGMDATPTGGASTGAGGATGGTGATGGIAGSETGGTTTGDGGTAPATGGMPGGTTENQGANCDVSAGELVRNDNLPDPFAMNDGTRISTMAEWECRRNEIKKDIEQYEIGPKPDPPTVEASLSGSTLTVNVTTSSGSITLSSTVGSASGSGPHCVSIGMNGNSSLMTGCVQVPFMHDQAVRYAMDGSQFQSDPFYVVYPELWGQIGNYSAWSWGISRLIDGLEQVKDQLNIDMTRIGVHGCSYAGKMALFGGAFDERIALTIAQESGGGGINSWRTSQDFTTRTGTNIEKIDNTSSAWFMPSMLRLDPYSLPHDHHELVAMIAPRAIVALGNRDYEWLGDESGYKSMMAAREVWIAMGIPDRIGFDFTTGHTHCAAAASQVTTVNAFVDKFLKGLDTDTNIMIEPPADGFDLDHTNVIDWDTPTLQ